MAYACPSCRLPDPDNGDGDGDQTCRCDRCPCGMWAEGYCNCEDNGDTRTRDADWELEVA